MANGHMVRQTHSQIDRQHLLHFAHFLTGRQTDGQTEITFHTLCTFFQAGFALSFRQTNGQTDKKQHSHLLHFLTGSQTDRQTENNIPTWCTFLPEVKRTDRRKTSFLLCSLSYRKSNKQIDRKHHSHMVHFLTGRQTDGKHYLHLTFFLLDRPTDKLTDFTLFALSYRQTADSQVATT